MATGAPPGPSIRLAPGGTVGQPRTVLISLVEDPITRVKGAGPAHPGRGPMSTLAHDDDARVATGAELAPYEVQIIGGGRAALLIVRAPAEPVADDALLRGALDALLGAGVVHGLDRGHVEEVVAARDGAPRAVARATLPTAPVDGTLELPFAEDAAHDPLHTVPAGTLLARCTPATPGVDGVAVTGAVLASPEPQAPCVCAGEGAEESVVGEGIVVVRALVDGRPRFEDGCLHVDPVVHVREVRPRAGAIEVFGSLEVEDSLFEGVRVHVTGDLRVGRDVERAHIESGGDVRIAGSCLHSEIRAGALASIHRRLLGSLGEADAEIASATAMAAQVVETAAQAGRRLSDREALHVVVASRFPGLESGLAAAAHLLASPGMAVEDRVHDAIVTAAGLVGALMRGDHVVVDAIASAGAVLGRAMVMMRSTAAHTSDVEASYMQASRVETRGSLILTGHGVYNVDAEVGGDLRAQGAATVRGGTVRVGGRLMTTELGAPGGAPVHVVLTGPAMGERLTAGVAHPGVEIVCGERAITIESTTLNLSVGVDEDNRVVCSEDPLG